MKRLVVMLALVAGCARLDGFLYAPEKTDHYELPADVTELTFPSSGGVTLYAAHRAGSRPITLVYCHGQATDLTDAWPRLELLAPLGYSLLVWDYRGFGRSTGTPSERGIHDDEEALWTMVSAMAAGQSLVYYGRSFGGAPCIDLATRHPPAALIEESTFTSVDALVHDGADVDLPRAYVADDSWNSLAKIATLGAVPFLALHGDADDYVQPKYSVELTAAHPGTTQLVLVPGADHSNVPDKMGLDQYRATVDAFVTAAAPPIFSSPSP